MKLRNKLILSCAALAAVATTAFSTTFAWYTSNTEVTATDITATTKNQGADLLMISKDKTKWGTTISYSGDTFSEMLPVAYTTADPVGTGAAAKILTATSTTGTAPNKVTTGATTGEQTTKVATFTFYLKNAADTAKTVNMKFVDFANTNQASLPDKSIIDSETNSKFLGLAATASSYTVNALRVLCADIEVYNYTTGAADPTFTSENAYSLANVAKTGTTTFVYNDSLDNKTAASAAITTVGSTYSAQQYYSSVMKETLTDNSADIDTSTIANKDSVIAFTVPAANDAAHKDDFIGVTIKLFLNGWDEACFDACQGQNFTFGLDFQIPQA